MATNSKCIGGEWSPPHPTHPIDVWSFNEQVKCSSDFWYNRPISQIPKYICAISHNAAFCSRNVHMCAHFCYKMVHCGIFVWCIVGFVRWVYWGESLPTTIWGECPPPPIQLTHPNPRKRFFIFVIPLSSFKKFGTKLYHLMCWQASDITSPYIH